MLRTLKITITLRNHVVIAQMKELRLRRDFAEGDLMVWKDLVTSDLASHADSGTTQLQFIILFTYILWTPEIFWG